MTINDSTDHERRAHLSAVLKALGEGDKSAFNDVSTADQRLFFTGDYCSRPLIFRTSARLVICGCPCVGGGEFVRTLERFPNARKYVIHFPGDPERLMREWDVTVPETAEEIEL